MSLISYTTCDRLLGCYLQNPSLTLDSKYPLQHEEFLVKFHEIIYVIIYNLALSGCKQITLVDINEWLKPYVAQYNIYIDNNGDDYVQTVIELSSLDNFEYYYTEFRKFSCLNAYKEKGFDIKKFYDEDKSEESQLENLNQYSIEDIVNWFEGQQEDVKSKYLSLTSEEVKCGDGFEVVKESFKETPYFGAIMCSPYQTALYRGWCRGHLLLRSAPSGFGKSILAVGELCNVCAKEIWNDEIGDFVVNPNYQDCGGLFINTEMDLETELTPMFVAYISNVSRSKIMDGKYDSIEEEKRVDRAIEILHESNIWLVDDPKFTIASLECTIKKYVYNQNVGYVIVDYLQDNGIIGKEMKKTHEVVARDTIILNLAEELKTWARMYNIGIYTSTQLNGNEKTQDIIDESCLAGGKAVKNKIDAGNIIMYPRKKELTIFDKIDERKGFGNIKPNIVSHNYKVRFGKYGSNIKIFQYADLGTGRVQDLCCVNVLNQPVKIDKVCYER